MNGSTQQDDRERLIPDPRGGLTPRQHVEQRLTKMGVSAHQSPPRPEPFFIRIADEDEVIDIVLDEESVVPDLRSARI